MSSSKSTPSGSYRGWKWSLRHPITLRAITVAMAGIGGMFVTNYFQEQTWVRETQFQIFSHTLDEGFRVVDDISKTTSKRLFGLNRVIWVAKGTGTGNLDQSWDAYYESVLEWNTNLSSYKRRLARFIDEDAAEAFSNQKDAMLSYSEGTPVSLHGKFMVAHQKVRALVDCVRAKCDAKANEQALQAAQQQVNDLGVSVDDFLQRCTDALYSRTGSEEEQPAEAKINF